MIYLIGSLRNPEIPKIANRLREHGLEVFDDWYAAGEHADDAWRDYELARGHNFREALQGHAARNVFEFDKRHIARASAAILACPAGKSGHLELGVVLGSGRPGYILLDGNPERFDVMYQFATLVTDNLDEIVADIKRDKDILYKCYACGEAIRIGQAYTCVGNNNFIHWDCRCEEECGCQESTTNTTETPQQELFTLEEEALTETHSAT